MKFSIYVLIVILSITSCTQKNDDAEMNVALIQKYIEAVEKLDYSAMNSVLDDSYIGLGPSYQDSIRKEQVVANWKYNVEHLYESITYGKSKYLALNIDSGENKGKWVSNWAELTIVYKKDNDKVTIWANTIYQIENDKIIKSFSFYNEADVLEQLGYVFIDPNDI